MRVRVCACLSVCACVGCVGGGAVSCEVQFSDSFVKTVKCKINSVSKLIISEGSVSANDDAGDDANDDNDDDDNGDLHQRVIARHHCGYKKVLWIWGGREHLYAVPPPAGSPRTPRRLFAWPSVPP